MHSTFPSLFCDGSSCVPQLFIVGSLAFTPSVEVAAALTYIFIDVDIHQIDIDHDVCARTTSSILSKSFLQQA